VPSAELHLSEIARLLSVAKRALVSRIPEGFFPAISERHERPVKGSVITRLSVRQLRAGMNGEENGMTDKSEDGNNVARQLPPKKDAFLVKPIILVVVLFLIEAVPWYFDLNSSYTLFIVLAALVVATVFLVIGIKHLVQGRYKLALFLILFIPFQVLLLQSAQYVAYHTKLTLHEKQYLEEIKLAQPDENGLRYKSFLWSGRYGEGTELVYDESDELELTEPPRTYGWWWKAWEIKVDRENEERAKATAAEEVCPYGVYKMKSHFYVVVFSCG
jgi:hypothetical protein